MIKVIWSSRASKIKNKKRKGGGSQDYTARERVEGGKKKKKEKETAEHAVERGEWEEITRRGWQGRAKDIGRAWN